MIINNIDTKDISVVVQGAIDKVNTPICLKSIRKYLPGAEIILSTWEGSEVDGLDYDILVLNEDPGNYICDEVYKVYNNVNRQIVSTKNGLKKATKKYAIKIRSDMEIIGTGFLNYFGKFKKRCEECKILKERVIINNLYCANPLKTNFLFHVSDWVFFGLLEDILNIWDIPLQSEDVALYFKKHNKPTVDSVKSWLFQFIPEQYIWINFLKKNDVSFTFTYYNDINETNLTLSELSFANNLIILNYEQFGIKFLKFDPYKWNYNAQYNYYDFLNLYKKYCDKNYKIPLKYRYKNDLKIEKLLLKFKKHWKNFFQPVEKIVKRFFKWFGEFFAVLFYGVKIVLNVLHSFCK